MSREDAHVGAAEADSSTERFVDRLEELRVVNGVGPATRLGGLPLHREVLEAMGRATAVPMRMARLERAAGEHVSRLLDVEAAYVTSGAFSALVLATAAAIAGDDATIADTLPHPVVPRVEVVIQAAHRDPYDRAVEVAGGRVVTIGYPGSTHVRELEAAIGERTAAVLFRPGHAGNHVPLDVVCEIAHARGVPVIVDGALHVPPLRTLTEYFRDGADMVALSGGKVFRGPQASGLLCGRAEWIERVGVHHQDMDEREATWPEAGGRFTAPPRHGVARGSKVGREQLVGLVTAIERFLTAGDLDADEGVAALREAYGLLQASGLSVRWVDRSVLGSPEVLLHLGDRADRFVDALRALPLPVFVEEGSVWRGEVSINAIALSAPDGIRIAQACISAAVAVGLLTEEAS